MSALPHSIHQQQQQHEYAEEHQEPRQPCITVTSTHLATTTAHTCCTTVASHAATLTTRHCTIATTATTQQFLQLEGRELEAEDGWEEAIASRERECAVLGVEVERRTEQ